MHKNTHFNIIQAEGNCNPNFVVIKGQRTDSGQMAPGGKVVSEPMSRDDAIAMADDLQSKRDAYVMDQNENSQRQHEQCKKAGPTDIYGGD